MFEVIKMLTLFKLYVMELFREVFKQLGMEFLLHLLTGDDNIHIKQEKASRDY